MAQAALLLGGLPWGGHAAALELRVSYAPGGLQPLVEVDVGGQKLLLVFDTSSGDTALFVSELHACRLMPDGESPHCYSIKQGLKQHSLHICRENQQMGCDFPQVEGQQYRCSTFLGPDDAARAHPSELVINGLRYIQ